MPKNQKRSIPSPIISILMDELTPLKSRNKLESMFMYAGIEINPIEPKAQMVKQTLEEANFKELDPLSKLGIFIKPIMDHKEEEVGCPWDDEEVKPSNDEKLKRHLKETLDKWGLCYHKDGTITNGISPSSATLEEHLKIKSVPAIEEEFYRAIKTASTEPRQAVSAACNILESLFKQYIHDKKLDIPAKQDIQGLWKVVKNDLGLDQSITQDKDLKGILQGINSIVSNTGSFRTHASVAHGESPKRYKVLPRHARLVVNSAHSLALFILETWEDRDHAANQNQI
ncbi:abortive infection family protein [Cobetia sp. 10Alg 146]|uniref:abortive infection family protein n=1 Tax=Cobetia sp. 10Alg 146 TaxID=3040019 RepID=UPI00244BEAC9|nr:abortive infection family protein [Cobetia sp. 10Alg 146]MDH2289994.1 abortive infection family protein [Cobetia sp. 10Alg 146]